MMMINKIFKNRYASLLVLALMLEACVFASAIDAVNPVLRPPRGAQVAIVVFEDLQCPQCRRVAPILEQASKTYKIPLVRHDFPLPMHNWSYDAAVMARYFDATSKDLGKAIKLEHTPTVYIVSSRHPDKPYVEMKDASQLYALIDAMMKN